MNTIRLKRSPGDGPVIAQSRSCISCGGCGKRNFQVDLSEAVDEITRSITAYDCYLVFWNSLGKPIIYLILATLMADVFGLNEPESLIAMVIGFLLGFLNCKSIPQKLLEESNC